MKSKLSRFLARITRGSKSVLLTFLVMLLPISTTNNLKIIKLDSTDVLQETKFSHVNAEVIKVEKKNSEHDQSSPDIYKIYLPLILNGTSPLFAFNKNAPVSGSTGVSLAPVLSWNASTYATKYEYCYDTTDDGVCSTWTSTGTNTNAALSALQPETTYYWQVRSWNGTTGPTYANGSSNAFWSFTTLAMTPDAFNKNAPVSGSTGVSLAPVLSWNASTYATKYEYCYDTTDDGDCSTWTSTGTNTNAALVALQPETTYYWQVRSWNGTTGPTYANGSANAFWSFTTLAMTPGAFNKNAPASGSTGVSLAPVLSWNASTYATKYEYCYDTTDDGDCSTWTSTGTNTNAALVALQPETTYYWQVRSWSGTSGPIYADGSLSTFWQFTTSSQYLLQNGDFELGDLVWTQYSTNERPLIVNNTEALPVSPHNGSWLAWFGGEISERSEISQLVTIPAEPSILSFWIYTDSVEPSDYDVINVYVDTTSVYDLTVNKFNNTYGWVHQTVDLSDYAGQTTIIRFIGDFDSSFIGSVFLDDISVEAATSLSSPMSENDIMHDQDANPSTSEGIDLIKGERLESLNFPMPIPKKSIQTVKNPINIKGC